MPDWFEQNKPKKAKTTNQDWFAQNKPMAEPAVPETPGYLEQMGTWGGELVNEMLVKPFQAWQQGDLPGMFKPITDPLVALGEQYSTEGPVAESIKQGEVSGTVINLVPWFGPQLNEAIRAQAQGDTSTASAIVTQMGLMLAAGKYAPKVKARLLGEVEKVKSMSHKEAKAYLKAQPEIKGKFREATITEKEAQRTAQLGETSALRGEAKQQLRSQVLPLRQQIKGLELKKEVQAEGLAKATTELNIKRGREFRTLRQRQAVAKTQLELQAQKDAQTFARSVGTRKLALEKAVGVENARQAIWREYTDKVTGEYDKVREVASRHVTEIPVEAPEGMPQTRTVELSSTRLKSPEALREYNRLKEDLNVAVSQNSPGARMLQQYFEGEEVVGIQSLIDDLSTANNIRYNRADPVFRTQSERLASLTAESIRNSIKQAAESLPEADKGIVLQALENAKANLQTRDSILKAKGVKRGAKALEEFGDITRLKNDPIALNNVWRILDEENQQAFRGDMLDTLATGDFVKNWTTMNPEAKRVMFTAEEIARGDSLAVQGPEGVNNLVRNFKQLEEQQRRAFEEQKLRIAEERKSLTDITRQVKDLNDRIASAKEGVRDYLEQAKIKLEDQQRIQRSELGANLRGQKREMDRRALEAQTIVGRRTKRLKALGWGAAAFGSWRIMDAIRSYISGTSQLGGE